MIKIKKALVLLIFGVNLQVCISQDIDFSTLDNYFIENVDSCKIAGAITLIAKNDEILHLKSYGYSAIENGVPINTETLIPIASMTKVMTTIAILQLYEKGEFLLDDPIENYIPEFKKVRVLTRPDSSSSEALTIKPTIRDFLRHTSGIVYSDGESYTDKLYLKAGFRQWNKPLEDFISAITEIPLAFQPNKKWNYGYSHDILGFLVEKVTGTPLNQYFKSTIFNPLNMKNTDFYVPKNKSNKLSNLYIYEKGKLIVDDHRDSSIYNTLPNAISGGGGWWSPYGGVITSIDDFYTLAKMLLNFGSYNNTAILKPETVRLMIANQIGDLDAYGNKYGLGVGVEIADNGDTKEIFWAGGPYNSYFWIDYEKEIIGIMFTNTAPLGHLGMMDKYKELTEDTLTN
jgi:CubicO group peptidase (beta-lactamase class C family)